jgi:hypothetical protein
LKSTKSKGNIIFFILLLLASGSIGAIFLGYFATYIPKETALPSLGLATIFMLPIAALWPLFKNGEELDELKLTATEKARVKVMITSTRKRIAISALSLFLFGITTAMVLYFGSAKVLSAKVVFSIIGSFIGGSICIFSFIVRAYIRQSRFKTKVVSRYNELVVKRALLKRTESKRN